MASGNQIRQGVAGNRLKAARQRAFVGRRAAARHHRAAAPPPASATRSATNDTDIF